MSELMELNDRMLTTLLLSIEAALEDDDMKMPDGWLELAEHYEAWIREAHVEAVQRGVIW